MKKKLFDETDEKEETSSSSVSHSQANKKAKTAAEPTGSRPIGANMSFLTKEAYNLLRTNILFSFADENTCHVIGVTSTCKGEGKSTTSVNLAYTLAEAGHDVVLIDADMRLSVLAAELNLKRSPGLSNLLAGINGGDDLLQESGISERLSIIAAGDVPPNPTELLSSRRMGMLLDVLRQKVDYIIIDLPPVGAVADPLIVAKLTDGVIVVAHENHVEKRELEDTMRQLQFQKTNILGFVVNCAGVGTKNGGGYYKHGYYKHGYYRHKDTDAYNN